MGTWVIENAANLVIVVLLAASALLALRHIHRNRKAGKCTCGCDGCGGCPSCPEAGDRRS